MKEFARSPANLVTMESRPFFYRYRHLAALLCLAACGGFLFGTFRERLATHAPAAPPLTLSPSPAPPVPSAGDDLERELGRYRADLADAETDEQRTALADRFWDLGMRAHFRDKGQGRVTVAALEEAVRLFDHLGDAPKRAECRIVLADAVHLRGNPDRARALWSEALPDIRAEADPVRVAAGLSRGGDFCRSMGDYDAARKLLNEALARLGPNGDRKETAHALRYLALVESDQGHYREAESCARRSLDLLAKLGETETGAAVRGILGDVYLRLGRFEEADREYRRGLSVWQERKQGYWTAAFLARRARVAVYRGDGDTAARLASESLSLYEMSNGAAQRFQALDVLGKAAAMRGDAREAVTLHRDALALRRKTHNPRVIAEGLESLAASLANLVAASGEAASLRAEAKQLRQAAGTPVPLADRPAR